MQLTRLFTILAIAMTGSALPTASEAITASDKEPDKKPGKVSLEYCSKNKLSTVCCNNDLLLGCTIPILAGQCDNNLFCCDLSNQVSHPLAILDVTHRPTRISLPFPTYSTGNLIDIDLNLLNCFSVF
ncbi:hypothetical protein VTI28DRAFT_5204 [Corynascus sepedonium]